MKKILNAQFFSIFRSAIAVGLLLFINGCECARIIGSKPELKIKLHLNSASTSSGAKPEDPNLKPVSISYLTLLLPPVFSVNVPISTAVPEVIGGIPTSFEISPKLPVGLDFNVHTGAISGTPRAPCSKTHFMVLARNSVGVASVAISFSIASPETQDAVDLSLCTQSTCMNHSMGAP